MTIVFSVDNAHIDDAGAPPPWTTAPRDASELRAYFENTFGEQWIASATARRFLMAGGDLGWKTTRIDDPDYRSLAARCADPAATSFEGTIVRHDERLWLLAVLTAAAEGCRRP